MEVVDVRERVKQNKELLRTNPNEYVRRLRAKAEGFVGQFREQLLEEADRIERERCRCY